MFEISDHSAMANDWHSEDVEVEILSSHENAEYRGKICVIKTVSGPTCSVWIISADQTISVGCEDLKPVQPQKNHKVAKVSLNIVETIFFRSKYYMVMILVKQVNSFQLMVMMESSEWTKTNSSKFSS